MSLEPSPVPFFQLCMYGTKRQGEKMAELIIKKAEERDMRR